MRSVVQQLFRLFAFAGMSIVMHANAQAPRFPSKPIRIVVPFGAGSGTDTIARVVGDELSRQLNTPVIVDNRVGVSGIIGVEHAAKSAPDGYTILLTSVTTISANPFLFKSLPYDPVRDFRPVANILDTQFVLLVRADAKERTVTDLIATLRADSRASYGWGSGVGQINGAAFAKRVGVSPTPVPYKSSPQAVTDLIGGQLTYMFLDSTAAIAQINGGRVRALAVASDARMSKLPNVPTLKELGVGGFSSVGWVGVLAPAGVPAPIVERLSTAILEVLAQKAVQEKLDASGTLIPMKSKEFGEFLVQQRRAWQEAIRDADIEPQ